MSASEHAALLHQAREADIARWRRRARLVRKGRAAVLGAIGLILLGFAGSIAYNALRPGPDAGRDSGQPIRLLKPRLVGRDEQGRAFAITAASATRDSQDYQKVYLDRPALVMDEQGPNPMRLTARSGVYHEEEGKLRVGGGVRLSGSQGGFETADSQFDTKTGELVGSGPIQGSGALGEMQAKSYGVYDRGQRMVFQGGVRARLNPQ